MTPFPLAASLGRLGAGHPLTEVEAYDAVSSIMDGGVPEAAISALLTALRVKGEAADELAGAVRAVRERMTALDRAAGVPVLDTCGTGGDGAHTVNVSTAAAVVVAACGVPVAKHGNRSASGNSGSAEVLTELGVAVEAEPPALRRCLAELGITFLFAPRFHPALRHAGPVRRQLPFRTLFNLVGPLANPARPEFQLVGAPGAAQAVLLAEALARLGSTTRAAVVTGGDGMDEVTLDGATHVLVVEGAEITPLTWLPADFGLAPARAADLRVTGPPDSARRLRQLFAGETGPVRDVVLANAAAALWVAGRAESLAAGVARAGEALDSGAASDLLGRWAHLSHHGAV